MAVLMCERPAQTATASPRISRTQQPARSFAAPGYGDARFDYRRIAKGDDIRKSTSLRG
jgi:hypothetical protein